MSMRERAKVLELVRIRRESCLHDFLAVGQLFAQCQSPCEFYERGGHLFFFLTVLQ